MTLLQAVAVGCGMMAGLYFAFSAFVMRSLAALPDARGIDAMVSINRVIVASPFVVLFFGTTLASLALGVWGVARWGQAGSLALVLGGAVYVLGHFGTTAAFNVPLNEALDRVDPASAEAARVWADYVVRWTRWNHVRTVACLASTVLFLTASR
ncbi:MAG: anthrone oxygenase family protein [Polyangiales bacterium]